MSGSQFIATALGFPPTSQKSLDVQDVNSVFVSENGFLAFEDALQGQRLNRFPFNRRIDRVFVFESEIAQPMNGEEKIDQPAIRKRVEGGSQSGTPLLEDKIH